MKRSLTIVTLALGGTLLAAGAARAQTTFYFGASLDTAVGLIPGKPMVVPVAANSYCSGALSAARFTIHYDTTAIRLTGIVPGSLDTIVDTTRGPGLLSVSGKNASMPCTSNFTMFSIQAVLDSGVSGTYLWTSIDTFTTPNGNVAMTQRTSIAQVCQATNIYGDVNGDGQINSLDALIVLSAAVGLPVNGFDLQAGDVDRDGLPTSRDALLILSYSIGLSVPTTLQAGEGDPVACPGTTAPGERIVFKRGGVGIEVLDTTATSPSPVPGTTPYDSAPRLAGNGLTVFYQCADSIYPTTYSDLCRILTNGTGKAHLTPGAYTQYSYYTVPDIRPDTSRLLFLSSAELYTMFDSVNAPQAAFTGPFYYVGGVAWSRDGTHLAFTTSSTNTSLINNVSTSVPYGVYVLDTAATTLTKVDTAYTYGLEYGAIRWSPKGDSIAYVRPDGRIWAVLSAGGSTVATPLTNFAGTINGFDWGPQGLLFSLNTGNGHPSLWLLPSGGSPIRRITAGGAGDWQPAFRRNP